MTEAHTSQSIPHPDRVDQVKLRALLRPGTRPPALGGGGPPPTHSCSSTPEVHSFPSWHPSSIAIAAPPCHQEGDDLNLDDLPSDLDIAITHLTAAYRAWLPSIGAPPLLLKTHIYSILKDRTQTDRDLEDLRRSRVIVMFKLSTGMDEHAILRTSDYASILHSAAAAAERSAAVVQGSSTNSSSLAHPPPHPSHSASRQAPNSTHTSTAFNNPSQTAAGPGMNSFTACRSRSTSEHTIAVERFLANVVLQGQCRCDVSIPHSELLRLLALPPRPVTSAAAAAASGCGSKRKHTSEQEMSTFTNPPSIPSQQQQRLSFRVVKASSSVVDVCGAPFASPSPGLAARLVAVSAAAGATAAAAKEAKALAATPSADRCLSLLLNMGALARHTSQDATYLLSVPGAGGVIKGIAAGRQELLGLLRKKKYGEIPEALLRSSGKLKHSVLSIDLHLRDLLGRGAVSRVATTVGPLIKLTSNGLAQGAKHQHR